MLMNKTDAAVFILLGQSNAVGYATCMTDEDKLDIPLKNVFGLNRIHNLSFTSTHLKWTGYTSHGTILGEENDHTYSITNCLAHDWQSAIDKGADLPDLYLINISIGAQGVTPGYMWHPHRAPVLVPGPLGTVDISLCPFAAHIFSLLDDSFASLGKSYEIIGIHWRGGENDFAMTDRTPLLSLKSIYQELFHIFYASLKQTPPVVLHRIICNERANDLDPTGVYLENLHYINSIFEELAFENHNISIFDVRNAPTYELDSRQHGVFLEDVVHFNPATNHWVAKTILESYIAARQSY